MNPWTPRDEDADTDRTTAPVHGRAGRGAMNRVTDIDERWVAEWVAFGLSEMETYLRKHAQFTLYCERRSLVRRGRANG
jgi:hypothetical protein